MNEITQQESHVAQQLEREFKARFRLSQLNHRVAAAYRCDPAKLPSSRRNLIDAQSGRLPVHQDPLTHFWMVDEADLPRIAALWGLVPSPEASPRTGVAVSATAAVAA